MHQSLQQRQDRVNLGVGSVAVSRMICQKPPYLLFWGREESEESKKSNCGAEQSYPTPTLSHPALKFRDRGERGEVRKEKKGVPK
eukprot:600044-Hanusia_phi.AAC.2